MTVFAKLHQPKCSYLPMLVNIVSQMLLWYLEYFPVELPKWWYVQIMAWFHHAKDYYLEYCPPNSMMPYVTSVGTMCQLNVPLETTIIKSKEPDHLWFRKQLITCSVSNHLPQPDLMKNVVLWGFFSKSKLNHVEQQFKETFLKIFANCIPVL